MQRECTHQLNAHFSCAHGPAFRLAGLLRYSVASTPLTLDPVASTVLTHERNRTHSGARGAWAPRWRSGAPRRRRHEIGASVNLCHGWAFCRTTDASARKRLEMPRAARTRRARTQDRLHREPLPRVGSLPHHQGKRTQAASDAARGTSPTSTDAETCRRLASCVSQRYPALSTPACKSSKRTSTSKASALGALMLAHAHWLPTRSQLCAT